MPPSPDDAVPTQACECVGYENRLCPVHGWSHGEPGRSVISEKPSAEEPATPRTPRGRKPGTRTGVR